MQNELTHSGILKKFNFLKGEILHGKKLIKGESKEQRVPADDFVPQEHILHDLIRGFYKPAKMPYLISYQATESDENYGQQILWKDKEKYEFEMIEMLPPSSPKDNRKVSDIRAARYNLQNKIPLGILYKLTKGVNVILGLGIITEERPSGVFIVKPYIMKDEILSSTHSIKEDDEIIKFSKENNIEITEILREIKQRIGQEKFRKSLLKNYRHCEICNIKSEYSIASHIKPWGISENNERLDKNNGLLLCPNHDYLFDRGLISFNSSGQIIISPHLTENEWNDFNINSSIFINSQKREKYMSYHRDNVFRT